MSKRTLITRLKETGIVQRKQVQLSHAGMSDIYFDIKKAYGYPDILQLITEELWKLIQKDAFQHEKDLSVIAATGYGGITPASIVALDNMKYLTLVRTELKQHGLNKHIECYKPVPSDLIALIDDVGTTGKTLQKATDILQKTGADVLGAYFVVKRGDIKLSVPFRYVMTADELL